jgi:hypothetical protein
VVVSNAGPVGGGVFRGSRAVGVAFAMRREMGNRAELYRQQKHYEEHRCSI